MDKSNGKMNMNESNNSEPEFKFCAYDDVDVGSFYSNYSPNQSVDEVILEMLSFTQA